MLESESFHPGRSGRNHLRILAAAAGLPTERVDDVLATVELTDAGRRRVGGYSLGMRQRLSVAGALLGQPRLLVLDEPANGLDPEGIRWLRDFLRSFAGEGGTVLISSHVLAEVAQIADEVVIIHRGRLVTQEPLEALTARSAAGAAVVRSPDATRLREALARAGLEAGRVGDDGLRVAGPAERVGEVAAAEGIVLHELRTEGASLEEIFLELTAEGRSDGAAPRGAVEGAHDQAAALARAAGHRVRGAGDRPACRTRLTRLARLGRAASATRSRLPRSRC